MNSDKENKQLCRGRWAHDRVVHENHENRDRTCTGMRARFEVQKCDLKLRSVTKSETKMQRRKHHDKVLWNKQ